jgi:hypothetical protein
MDILLVDQNVIVTVDFPVTGWNEMSRTTTVPDVALSAGSNTITLTLSGKGAIDMDKLMTVDISNIDSPQDDAGDDPVDEENNAVHVIYSTDVPSGDHTQQIQTALDTMNPNNAIHLIGDFIIFRTIYLPSDLTWRLEGTLSLGANATLDILDWRPGAITEKKGGASNIQMSGGLYRDNRNQNVPGIRFLNFVQVQ